MYLVTLSWTGLFAALSVVLWQAFQLEGGAAFYPRVVLSGAFLSAGLLLLSQVAGSTSAQQRKAVRPREFGQLARVTVFVLIWAGYVFLLFRLGFMVATWLALTSSLAVARARTSLTEMLAVAAFVLVFTVLIKFVLYVPMPQGWLDERLEILLYSYL